MRLLLLLACACALSVRAASSTCPVDALVLRRGLPSWNEERNETPTGSHCAALPARSARACCDACASKGASACGTFVFRPRDGLCLLAAAKGHCQAVTQGRDWVSASMTAQPTQSGCSAREVAGSNVSQAIQALKRETEGLQDKLWAFWSLYGPDGVNGGFHTTLNERGEAAPPAVKSARRAAEDLQALSVFADRASRTGNSRAAQRAQELAGAQFGFLMRTFAPQNGTSLVDVPGSAASAPQLLTTHLQVISALSAYARVAPNATASNAALRAAERQAAAAEKCCYDEGFGGFASRLEVAQGWFPAGTQKALGAHLSAIHAASSHRNASLGSLLLSNASTPQRSAPSGALSAAALPELLRLTQRMFAAAPLRGGAPFVPSLFDEQWRGVGAGGAPPDVDYGANMAVLTTVVSTMRSLADNGRLRVNDSLLAGAIQAARAASEEGYDPSCGGIFERGVPGAGPSGASKLYYEQTSAVTASVWLWRLTGEAVHLCRARHSLARLARVQLAPAGEFYWALADGEGCVAGAPIGMHGSALAEPWKGAASLGSLASLGDLLDEISAEEVAAAVKRPQPAPAAWGPSQAQPSSSTTPSPPPQQRTQTAPPNAPWMGDSCGAKNVTQLRVNESLPETGLLPGGTVNALVVGDAGACCSACLSSAACDTFAFRAADGICALRRQSNISGDSVSRAWLLARPARRPLSARPQGGCPAAMPALVMDAQLLDLAGLAGKASGGSRNTPVRLCAASCNASSSTEMLASAHVRGESSRRDYPKKSIALKLRKADTQELFAALGMSASHWATHPSSSLILGANYDDATLLRDWLTFNRSRAMGLPAPLTQPVELRAAGQDQGLYWLTQRPDVIAEQAARAAARDAVNVTVASFDPWDEAEEDVFVPLPATLSSRLRLARPEPGEADAGDTHARVSALANVLAASASASGNRSAACDWPAFSAVADVGAFVTFFVLNEWSNDPDAYAKSTFLSYDGARLTPGPLWDKNLAFGGREESAVSGWRALASCSSSCDVLDNQGSLFGLLARHCAPFWTAVAQRWRAARAPGGPMTDAAVDAVLREQSARLLLSGAVARERSRWGRGEASTYAADVATLGGWSKRRAGWMDAELARKLKT